MNITEEMVRELQSRVDVTYEEAEYTLKRTRGDVNAALYIIMRRRNSSWERFKDGVKDVFTQLIRYRIIISRKGKLMIDLPLLVVVLLIMVDGVYRHLFPLFLIFIGILIFECDIKILKTEANEDKATTTVKTGSAMNKNRQTQAVPVVVNTEPEAAVVPEAPLNEEQKQELPKNKQGDDDYFEIVIEE